MSIEENFYVIETSKGSGIYLTDWEYDEGELMIMGTTKDVTHDSVARFSVLEQAVVFADHLYNDAFSEEPRALKVKMELEVKEVE